MKTTTYAPTIPSEKPAAVRNPSAVEPPARALYEIFWNFTDKDDKRVLAHTLEEAATLLREVTGFVTRKVWVPLTIDEIKALEAGAAPPPFGFASARKGGAS